jgi:lysophospholipase L1-like esterase
MQIAVRKVLVAAWFLGAAARGGETGAAGGGTDLQAALRRSLADPGDAARTRQILARARRGEPVTVGVIGGSITQGAGASKEEFRYGNRVAAWWRTTFPRSKIEFVNAGIGATGSNYGALRAQRDLLSKEPDFVIVEYGVNDGNARPFAETLEGLVRQVLHHRKRPAVVLLFMMTRAGANAQEWHGKVGRHYGLPMLSLRDALWPEIEAKRIRWEDVEADEVHPNDRGHGYAADYVTAFLAGLLEDLPEDAKLAPPGPVPTPLFSDLFERVALTEAADLKPVRSTGWTLDAAAGAWKSDAPGSVIEFDIDGQVILLMQYRIRKAMGKARAQVDGGEGAVLDGWMEPTWGGYRETVELARDLKPGRHRVRVEVLPEKNARSGGHEFRILGLGAAGAPAKR